jgi:predicted Ser/Thr protein kinase
MRSVNAAERILVVIGEPQMIDIGQGPSLWQGSLPGFFEPYHPAYLAFAGIYGMEETIERIVSFAQGSGGWRL